MSEMKKKVRLRTVLISFTQFSVSRLKSSKFEDKNFKTG